jgi:hypothetical protein
VRWVNLFKEREWLVISRLGNIPGPPLIYENDRGSCKIFK